MERCLTFLFISLCSISIAQTNSFSRNFMIQADTTHWYGWENSVLVSNPAGGESVVWDYTNEGKYKDGQTFIRRSTSGDSCFNIQGNRKYAIRQWLSPYLWLKTEMYQYGNENGVKLLGNASKSSLIEKDNYSIEFLANCNSIENTNLHTFPVSYNDSWNYGWTNCYPFVLNCPEFGIINDTGRVEVIREGCCNAIGNGMLILPYQDSLTREFDAILVNREVIVSILVYLNNELVSNDDLLNKIKLKQSSQRAEYWKYFINPENEFLATFSLDKYRNVKYADFLQEKSMVFNNEE